MHYSLIHDKNGAHDRQLHQLVPRRPQLPPARKKEAVATLPSHESSKSLGWQEATRYSLSLPGSLSCSLQAESGEVMCMGNLTVILVVASWASLLIFIGLDKAQKPALNWAINLECWTLRKRARMEERNVMRTEYRFIFLLVWTTWRQWNLPFPCLVRSSLWPPEHTFRRVLSGWPRWHWLYSGGSLGEQIRPRTVKRVTRAGPF